MAKIMSALRYINMAAANSLIRNAKEDVTKKNSCPVFCGSCLEVMIKKQGLESVYDLGLRLFLSAGGPALPLCLTIFVSAR